MQGLIEKWAPYLKHSRIVPLGILLSLFLYLPSLWVGMIGDDFFQYEAINGGNIIEKSTNPSFFGLFSFIDDNAARTGQLLNNAIVPWWMDEDFGFNFFRPIPELTHWFDYTYLNAVPSLMHVHSLLWLSLCLVGVYGVYRRLFNRIAKISGACPRAG